MSEPADLPGATPNVTAHAGPPPLRAASVEVLNLTKRFGAFTALDDVSMRVAAGTTLAILPIPWPAPHISRQAFEVPLAKFI